MTTLNPRYQGKPLLRLLECYVLWAIAQLPEEQLATLREMTPKLQSIYNKQGDWQTVIAAVMDLPSDFPSKIRELWNRNVELAGNRNSTLTPQQFAETFVDQNLMK